MCPRPSVLTVIGLSVTDCPSLGWCRAGPSQVLAVTGLVQSWALSGVSSNRAGGHGGCPSGCCPPLIALWTALSSRVLSGPGCSTHTPCLLPLQRSPVQANSSSSKTAGAPTGTVPQQLQVHGVQQSVPVTQEVPGKGGQWQGRGCWPGGLCILLQLSVGVAAGKACERQADGGPAPACHLGLWQAPLLLSRLRVLT